MATPQFPSGYNLHIPTLADSNNLIIDFGRNPNDFTVNRWSQIIKVPYNTGQYLVMTNEVCSRYLSAQESYWAPGTDRPRGEQNLESFLYKTFTTKRRSFSVPLDDLMVEQANYNVVAQYTERLAAQAMTARTALGIAALTDVGASTPYDASHILDIKAAKTSATGAYGDVCWDESTSATLAIKKALNAAQLLIRKDTLGTVKAGDLTLVIGPEVAQAIMQSQEIVEYIKGSPDAKYMLGAGTFDPSSSNIFGIPDKLYGVNVVVEDCVKVTSKKGASRAVEYAWPSDLAVLCARPGGIEGKQGPNFSTMCFFMKEEMKTETKPRVWDRQTLIGLTEDYVPQVIAPVSGVVLTRLLSSST